MSNITPLNPRRAPRRPVLITLEGTVVVPTCRVVDLARIAAHYHGNTGHRARLRCSGWDWDRRPQERRS